MASVIISLEQTQSNRVCCFQTLEAVFPKDHFSDYFVLNVDSFGEMNDPLNDTTVMSIRVDRENDKRKIYIDFQK